MLINGIARAGSYISGTGDATVPLAANLFPTVGQYLLQVNYNGNASYAAASGAATISVIPNTLPVPTVTVTASPLTLPLGEYGQAVVHVSCNTTCGILDLAVNGQYLSHLYVGATGDQTFQIPPSVLSAIGQYTLQVTYEGNASYAPAFSNTAVINVVQNTLPVPTVTVAVNPSTITQGNSAGVSAHVSCTSSTNCGIGDVYVNGQWLGHFYFNSTGDWGNYQIPASSLPAVGQYIIQVMYEGNASYAPTSGSTTLQVVNQ